MLLVIGIIVLVLGILLVRGCIRDYREKLGEALADDLWDYLNGHALAIVIGVLLVIVGAGIIFVAVTPGAYFSFSGKFPYLHVHRAPVQ